MNRKGTCILAHDKPPTIIEISDDNLESPSTQSHWSKYKIRHACIDIDSDTDFDGPFNDSESENGVGDQEENDIYSDCCVIHSKLSHVPVENINGHIERVSINKESNLQHQDFTRFNLYHRHFNVASDSFLPSDRPNPKPSYCLLETPSKFYNLAKPFELHTFLDNGIIPEPQSFIVYPVAIKLSEARKKSAQLSKTLQATRTQETIRKTSSKPSKPPQPAKTEETLPGFIEPIRPGASPSAKDNKDASAVGKKDGTNKLEIPVINIIKPPKDNVNRQTSDENGRVGGKLVRAVGKNLGTNSKTAKVAIHATIPGKSSIGEYPDPFLKPIAPSSNSRRSMSRMSPRKSLMHLHLGPPKDNTSFESIKDRLSPQHSAHSITSIKERLASAQSVQEHVPKANGKLCSCHCRNPCGGISARIRRIRDRMVESENCNCVMFILVVILVVAVCLCLIIFPVLEVVNKD